MNLMFDFTVLIVANVPAAQTFYRDALGLLPRNGEGHDYDGHYVELVTGDHRLGLVSTQLMARLIPDMSFHASASTGVLISFKVSDLRQAFDHAVNAGALVKAPPTMQPWGQESAFLADLDGNLVELVQAKP